MEVSYYPGCTLRNRAKTLDTYARACAEALGVTLTEIENWQCCGGVFSTARDEIATKLSSVRALMAARDKGQPLVTICSACHNVIKQTNHAMGTDPAFADAVNRYMGEDGQYNGEARVLHYLELLRDVVGFDTVRAHVKNSLSGKKIAPYYGCLLLRPASVMGLDDPENPTVMEDLIRTLGGEPVLFAQRNECCGGYAVLENSAIAEKNSTHVMHDAAACGAEVIVTACPLCMYNLTKNGNGEVPVVYLTELLADALGVKEDAHDGK